MSIQEAMMSKAGWGRSRLGRAGNPQFDTWQMLFGFAYRGLATGACLSLFTVPLAAVLIGLPRPGEAVPFLVLCALPLGPALGAAFRGFALARETGANAPFALFLRGLREVGRRSLGVWAIASALLVFLYVDVVAVAGTPYALLLGPLFAVLSVVVVAATPIALTALTVASRPGVLAAVKIGLYTALRRPIPSLVTILVISAWAVIILAQPVVGMIGLGGFALMLVGMNSEVQLAAVGVAQPTDRVQQSQVRDGRARSD